MRSVFILYDEFEGIEYTVLGVYSTLEKAAKAAIESRDPDVAIYQEFLDEEGQTKEPVYFKLDHGHVFVNAQHLTKKCLLCNHIYTYIAVAAGSVAECKGSES